MENGDDDDDNDYDVDDSSGGGGDYVDLVQLLTLFAYFLGYHELFLV